MTKIDIDATYPDGSPYGGGRVFVRLVDAGTGAAVTSDSLAVGVLSVTLDGDGHGEVDLTPNADVEPAGTYYSFTVDRTTPTVVRCIEVPAPNGTGDAEIPYSWADSDLERLRPTPPTSIPAASPSVVGKVLTPNSEGNRIVWGAAGATVPGLEARLRGWPAVADAAWWHGATPGETVFTDYGSGVDGIYDAIPQPVPHGSYLLLDLLLGAERPKFPNTPALEFADGVRVMWSAAHGLVDGWQPDNGQGYSDVLFRQSTGTDGVRDALEVGLRREDDVVRVFVDNTAAGAAVEDEFQVYSDPLAAEDYEGVKAFCVDVTFAAGDRVYEFYAYDPDGTDLSTPGAPLETWRSVGTETVAGDPGFYDSALDWFLGGESVLTEWVYAWDLGTDDLAIAIDAADAVPGGWTDGAGNDIETGNPMVVTVPGDGVTLPGTVIDSDYARLEADTWGFAFYGRIDPAVLGLRVGTVGADGSGAGWGILTAPSGFGGILLGVQDGTSTAAVPTGITDCAKHLIAATRDGDTIAVWVDGEEAGTADASALGPITGATYPATAYGSVTDLLAFWDRALTADDVADLNSQIRPGSSGGGTVDVLSNVASARIIGRTTAGSGDSEELTASAARTLLGVYDSGTVDTALAGKQPVDSDLTDLAALSPSNDDIVQRKAGAWTNRTLAQLKTDLAIAAFPTRVAIEPSSERPNVYTVWTATQGAVRTGGYATGGSTVGSESWTYSVPVKAGTWRVDLLVRKTTAAGIITCTFNGSSVGTIDTYAASNSADNDMNVTTSLTIAADGTYDLVLTNPTKNASSGGYSWYIQAISMTRTGS